MDVAVKPGITFDTDHRLLTMKLRKPPEAVWGTSTGKIMPAKPGRRLRRLQVSLLDKPEVVREFSEKLTEAAEDLLLDSYDLWACAVRRIGESVLGTRKNNHRPQWQQDNAERLEQISREKREAAKFRKDGGHKRLYKQAVKKARQQVAVIASAWWLSKDRSIQKAIDNKDPQYQHAGYRELRGVLYRPKRPLQKLRDAKGAFTATKTGRLARWREYFEELLNVSREVSDDMVGPIQRVPSEHHLGVSPQFLETVAAVRRLKAGTAPGVDGIETERIKSLNDANLRVFHEHLERIWRRLDPLSSQCL